MPQELPRLLEPSLVDGVPEDEVAGTVLDEDDEAEGMDELVAEAFGMAGTI